MTISKITPEAGKSAVKEKINELIDFLNNADLKPKPQPVPKPAAWSQSSERTPGEWHPKNPDEPLGFWLDPQNIMQKREAVPAEAVEKWELEHTIE